MSQFTKKAIVDSFLKLLSEKPLDKITVKDIVEDCGVSRNSFYYYYQDIFALMDDMFSSETEKALQLEQNFSSWQDALIGALQFALQNKRVIANVCHSGSRDHVERYLYSVTEKVLKECVDFLSKDLHTSEWDRQFIAHFYMYALVGLFLEWVDNGLKDEPEAVIRRMGTLLDGNMRAALLKSDAADGAVDFVT